MSIWWNNTPKSERPRCLARTRAGGSCQARVAWDKTRFRARNGRCRMHGGLSTGPRSEAGREAIRASNRRRARGNNNGNSVKEQITNIRSRLEKVFAGQGITST